MATLIIGLGGTGTKIVRRIRKRWDDLGEPVNAELAIIDARSEQPEEGPVEGAIFTPNPTISFPEDFHSFREHTEGWWPEMIQPDSSIDFSNGCGAVRANGRYFAFRFARIIRQTVDAAIQNLIIKEPRNLGGNARRVVVYLVGSLGNGTCGGAFMDIATIVRSRMAERFRTNRIYGVFVPGSVTRLMSKEEDLGRRIGASGFASLVELQYEANRNGQDDFRPRQAYQFQGWADGMIRTFALSAEENPRLSPIDRVFIMNGYDTAGRESDYPTLLNVAAEAIGQLVGGADANDRLLDGFVAVPADYPFGSLGALRLVVPGKHLLRYAVLAKSLEGLGAGTSVDLERWRELLELKTLPPEPRLLLPAHDASIEKHVGLFLEHVLEIREREMDQVLDRFKDAEESLVKDFDEIMEGVATATKPADIKNKGVEIWQFVESALGSENDRRLEKDRKDVLLAGPGSLWLRRPRNPETPTDAGIKWKIDRMVSSFVRAGAFSLLAEWLDELKRQLDANKKSLQENERARYLSNPGCVKVDHGQSVKEMQEQANSFFAWFKRAAMAESLNQIATDARAKFDFLLWEAKIVAAEELYSTVYAYADMLKGAALRAVAALRHPRLLDRLRQEFSSVEEALDANALKVTTRTEGVSAEYHFGGHPEGRRALMRKLEESMPGLARALLARVADENENVFLFALGDKVGEFTQAVEPGVLPSDDVALADRYRKVLEAMCTKAIEDTVSMATRVDDVMRSEAEFELNEYFRKVHLEKNAIRQDDRVEAQRRLRSDAPAVAEIIRVLNWESNRDEAMQTAVPLYVAGRLLQLFEIAKAQWDLVHNVQALTQVHRFPFFTYHSDARTLARAAHVIEERNLLGDRAELRYQHDDGMDPRQAEITIVELGAKLESLNMGNELTLYLNKVTTPGSFCPHPSMQYSRVGLEYLDRFGRKLKRRVGGALAAMALEYGFLTVDGPGNYKVGREFSLRDRAGLVEKTFVASDKTYARGLAVMAQWLDGEEKDAVLMRRALAQTLWAAITADATGGEPGQVARGWAAVAADISRFAGEIEARKANVFQAETVKEMDNQVEALNALSRHLAEFGGKSVPRIFAD